ncbi:MAG: hypothetical protein MUO68_15825 [Desulfobacteraceae bacterium]|nr:hypothetical protein [Desulfobacteraceae bacterium]
MKKFLIIMVALFVSFAFVTGVMAAEKKAAVKTMKAQGTVTAYDAGKTLTVKAKKTELVFDIAADATVQGDVKKDAKVSVTYKKEEDKNIATSITAIEKKAKKKK